MSTLPASEKVRLARLDAGMSQRALAEKVGLKQPNIAAIEAGRRVISSDLLERVLEAADFRPSIPLGYYADEVVELARSLGIANVRVFGSVVHGADHHGSDVDLLVDLSNAPMPFALGIFQSRVAELLGFSVDVVVDSDAVPARIHDEAVSL